MKVDQKKLSWAGEAVSLFICCLDGCLSSWEGGISKGLKTWRLH